MAGKGREGMTGVIIAAHGSMAKAMLELAEMLAGEREGVQTIGFEPGDSLDMLIERFTTALGAAETGGGVVILADIKGGSPCNVATLMQKTKNNVRVVHGVNVPMLLQVLDDREAGATLEEITENAVEIGKFGIKAIELE